MKFMRGCFPPLGAFIVITAILVYIAFERGQENGLMSDASSECRTFLNAVEAFQVDYDRLPLPPPALNGEDIDLTTASHSGIVAILKGSDIAANPHGVNYLGEFRDAKLLDGKPFNGLRCGSDATMGIFDPWGRPYHLRFDGDGDGFVDNPSARGNKIKRRALIWSAGKDGDPSTWEDNVASFEFLRS